MCFSPALQLVIIIMIKYLQVCQRLCEEDCSQCGDSGDTVFSSCDWREWRYQPRPRTVLYSHLTSQCTVSRPRDCHHTQYARSERGREGGQRTILAWGDVLCTYHHPPFGKTFLTTGRVAVLSPFLLSLRRYLALQRPPTNHTSVISKSWAKINILCVLGPCSQSFLFLKSQFINDKEMHSNSFVDNRNKFLQYKDKILYGIFTFLFLQGTPAVIS